VRIQKCLSRVETRQPKPTSRLKPVDATRTSTRHGFAPPGNTSKGPLTTLGTAFPRLRRIGSLECRRLDHDHQTKVRAFRGRKETSPEASGSKHPEGRWSRRTRTDRRITSQRWGKAQRPTLDCAEHFASAPPESNHWRNDPTERYLRRSQRTTTRTVGPPGIARSAFSCRKRRRSLGIATLANHTPPLTTVT
jgi:hypothetical protein